jgi:hypothetical protein
MIILDYNSINDPEKVDAFFKNFSQTILDGGGVNFINVLLTDFVLIDPKTVRTQSSRQYLFTLLVSTSIKAVHKTLMKLTPGHLEVERLTLIGWSVGEIK